MLIPVVLRFVGTFYRHADIIGLLPGQLGQLDADLLQMQAGDFFVELLGQALEGLLAFVLVRPEINRRERLVREKVRHHEARMTSGAAEVTPPMKMAGEIMNFKVPRVQRDGANFRQRRLAKG